MSGQSPSSGSGFGKGFLYSGLFCCIQGLVHHASSSGDPAVAGTIAGMLSTLGAAYGKSLLKLGEKFAEDMAVKSIFPHDSAHPTASGLNHDLERALTRASTRTLVFLIREWEKVPPAERGSEETERDLLRFARDCEHWLDKHDHQTEPQAITAWVEHLNQSTIRALADLEPDQLLTRQHAVDLAVSDPLAGASLRFRQWFCRQFPRSIELHFWDELKKDTRAWRAFQGGLHKRTLELLAQANAKLDEQSAALLQISAHLARLSTQTADPGPALLDSAIRCVMAELQQSNAALLTAIRATLSNELLAVAGLINEHTTSRIKEGVAEIREELWTAAKRIKDAIAANSRPPLPTAPPWNPPPRSIGFTGRADELREVAKLLDQYQRVALVGSGGIGKTAIAAEVLFKHAPAPGAESRFPGGIYSHDYYGERRHSAVLAGLLGQAGVDLRTVTDPTTEVRRLFSQPGVLVYLESCEEAEELGLLLELAGQARVLLTTHDKQKRGDAYPYQVHPLAIEDAAQFLHYHARQSNLPTEGGEREPWLKLANELGRHPLALHLAGAWMQNQQEPLAEFSTRLQTERFGDWAAEDSRKANLHLLFQHSAKAVVRKHKKALEAWFGLALHGHAPVPLAILCSVLQQPEKTVKAMLIALVHYSLAERSEFPSEQAGQTEPAWRLTHALLGEWGREQWLPKAGRAPSGRSTEHPSAGRKTDVPKAEQCSVFRFEQILRAWHSWWFEHLNYCFKQRVVLGGHGRYLALQPHWESLFSIAERSWGAHSQELCFILGKVANAHWFMGNLTTAESLSLRALEISERLFGPEHPETLGSASNLAGLLLAKGDLARAEPILRQTLEARERVLGHEHPDTLASITNLGVLLHGTRDLTKAESLHRRALELNERVLGREHPATCGSVSSLAGLLRDKGDLAGAEQLQRRALEAQERMLGREHPVTLTGVYNLALLLHGKDDLVGAAPLYRRVLEAQGRLLGNEHPDTITTVSGLAMLMLANGDLASAEPLYRRALAARERTLGPEHPETLWSLVELSFILLTQEHWQEGEPLAERAVRGYFAKLGPEHSNTQIALRVLLALRKLRAAQTGGK